MRDMEYVGESSLLLILHCISKDYRGQPTFPLTQISVQDPEMLSWILVGTVGIALEMEQRKTVGSQSFCYGQFLGLE